MDDLLSLGETLQRASSALVGDDIPDEQSKGDGLPVLQVVVIGASGVGKSAVLNTLIGHAVLPTAEGGATRFPVLVDMQNDKNLPTGAIRGNLGQRVNLATATEIRNAIESDMKKWTPSRRNREEAQLSIRSPIAPPLRIIDLPGVEARASDLDSLIADNASNNDSILVVVVSATTIKDSLRVLRIAHDIDRDGTRTVGVVTKLDEVASDKDALKAALELLQGQGSAMASSYPWVAVMGQPKGDAPTNAPLDEAWQAEIKTLGAILRGSGHKGYDISMGRDALLKLLARTVRQKMKEKIPRIMAGLESRSVEVDTELLRLGEQLISSIEGSRAVALELCRGFETKFCEHLDGSEGGGAQMVEKFVGVLPLRFRALPLDDMFSLENVKKVCSEADGYQPYLMSPEKGLRLLIKRSLELAKQPGLDTVDEVHKILLDIVSQAGSQAPSLIRFPPMRSELVSIASHALDLYRAEAKTMVGQLVDMERVFIPPAHFIKAEYEKQERLWRELEMMRKGMQDRGVLPRSSTQASGSSDAQPGRLASAMRSMTMRNQPPPPPPIPNAPQAPMQELAGFLWKISSKGGWSKRWFALSDKTARLYYVKKPDEKTPRGVIPLDDCIVDDTVSPEECPAAPDMPKNGPPAHTLCFKISNRVPYKTVVKVHHNLVLRTDSLAEKNQWVARLRMHTKAARDPKDGPPPPPSAAQQEGRETPSDSEASDAEKDRATEKDAEAPASGVATAPGTGPGQVLRRADPEEEMKYMAAETKRYVQAVLAHLADNIPKAIVLTQVERSRDAMLTKLYQAVSALSDQKIQALLQEDKESKGKRERFRKLQEALVKLKRVLSLHEARASAEEYSQEVAESQEDWRKAFKKGTLATLNEEPAPSPRPSSSKDSSAAKPAPAQDKRPAPSQPTQGRAPASSPAPGDRPSSRPSAEASPGAPPASRASSFFRMGSSAASQASPQAGGPPQGAPNGAGQEEKPPMGPPMGSSRRRVPPPPPPTSVYK